MTSLCTFCCFSNSGVNWNGLGEFGIPAAGNGDDNLDVDASPTCLLALKDTPRWTGVANVGMERVARRNANEDIIVVNSKIAIDSFRPRPRLGLGECPRGYGLGIRIRFDRVRMNSLFIYTETLEVKA